MWVVIFLVRTWRTFWYQNNSDLLKFWIFNTSRFSDWGNACNLCYATSSTNYDVAYDVTCLALWRWIYIFLSVSSDDYRSCRLIYSFFFFYITVIRLEAWLTKSIWLTVNLQKKFKIKRKFTFFLVNTKYISSRELKTSKFSFVLPTHGSSDVFNTLDEICLVFTPKK